jgi:hypothetical protein
MLIQRVDDQLVVVRQTDHMAQVARIAERWGNDRFPAPEHREETIRAGGLHDNGWRLWEDHPTLVPETGRPRNLVEVEPAVHAAFYQAGVEASVGIDSYTGLLVSLHAAVLAAGVEGWDLQTLTPPSPPAMSEVARAYVAGQTVLQRRLRAELASSPRYGAAVEPLRLWQAYLRLRAWDRLSLYFVYFGMGEGALDHVPAVDGEVTVTLRQTGSREAVAEPWPFDASTVGFPVVATRVPDRRYANGDDFLATLLSAPSEICTYVMRAP